MIIVSTKHFIELISLSKSFSDIPRNNDWIKLRFLFNRWLAKFFSMNSDYAEWDSPTDNLSSWKNINWNWDEQMKKI